MTKQEIMQLLPHRDNMLLIDEAEVVPGVILCEILAQSACVLLAAGAAEGATPFFTSLDKVRFKNPVKPGDVFETTCTLVKAKGPFYFCTGKGTVNGKLCVTAEFSFALIGK